MNETEFTEKLKDELQNELGSNIKVERNKNLIYKVIVNDEFKYEPNDPKEPKRGSYAFQTDLLVTNTGGLPLVVIEIKYGGFTTHDVLTYSIKAQRHKEIYPYLRYGLVVGGENKIYNRFFTHNIGFDFAYAFSNIDYFSIKELTEIIKQQIENAHLLLDVLKNKNQAKKFSTIIQLDKIDGKSGGEK